jgi:hypothetical protein
MFCYDQRSFLKCKCPFDIGITYTKYYAVAVASGTAFGISIRIASSLTLAGPLSCPLGTPAILWFLLCLAPPGPLLIFFCPG